MTLGDKIKLFATGRLWTLSRLASEVGISPQALNRYVNNSVIPGADFLIKLKKIGCSLDWLLDDTEYDKNFIKNIYYRIEEQLIAKYGSLSAASKILSVTEEKLKLDLLNSDMSFSLDFLCKLAKLGLNINYILLGSSPGKVSESSIDFRFDNDLTEKISNFEKEFGEVVNIRQLISKFIELQHNNFSRTLKPEN